MTTYIATFKNPGAWAETKIKAPTPAQAMTKAHALAKEDIDALDWCVYQPRTVPLDEITIFGPHGFGTEWQSERYALRLASGNLLRALQSQTDAAQAVIDAWASGDLAGAVRTLDASIEYAREAIAKAEGEAASK